MLPIGLWITMLMGSLAGFVALGVERGERVVFDGRLLSLIVRESVARSLFWLLLPLGMVSSAPVGVPIVGEATGAPVLLVPGSSVNRGALAFLRTFLIHRGMAWVWAVNPRQHHTGIVEAAQALEVDVVRLATESGRPQVDLVAFGTGGLVAAWYARHLDTAGRIRRVVTIGTPWRGTKLSVFRRGRLGEDTSYGAHLLDDLVPSVPTVSIWSSDDPTVIPSSSAAPEGVQSVEIEAAGHAEMLVSARVFRAVRAALA
ncbi:MAG: hypothetical protein H6736_20035 [Alphaproteobacteria bacterium]|nr:hypothetical protein [Alphaproteobacteria bacterium]